MKHKLIVNGKPHEVTTDEARRIYNELRAMFEVIQVTPQPQPVYIPFPSPQYHDPIFVPQWGVPQVTCGNRESFNS